MSESTIEKTNWFPIGKVSEHFGISVSRLRGWCDGDLVEYTKDGRGHRKIPQTEFEKIEKIISLFDQRGATTTMDEVKDELRKNDLLHFEVQEQQQDERVNDILKAFGKTGIADVLQQLQQQLHQVQQGVISLPAEPQVNLTEDELKRVSNEQFTKIKALFEVESAALKKQLDEERERRQKLEKSNGIYEEQILMLKNQLKEERENREKSAGEVKKLEQLLQVEKEKRTSTEQKVDTLEAQLRDEKINLEELKVRFDEEIETSSELNNKLQKSVSRLEKSEETNEKLMEKLEGLTVWSLLKRKK